jgi:hypothetical protein
MLSRRRRKLRMIVRMVIKESIWLPSRKHEEVKCRNKVRRRRGKVAKGQTCGRRGEKHRVSKAKGQTATSRAHSRMGWCESRMAQKEAAEFVPTLLSSTLARRTLGPSWRLAMHHESRTRFWGRRRIAALRVARSACVKVDRATRRKNGDRRRIRNERLRTRPGAAKKVVVYVAP